MMEQNLMMDGVNKQYVDNKQKKRWLMFVTLSILGTLATIATVMHFEHKHGNSNAMDPLEPFLGATQMCDTCMAIPGFDEYQTCKSCYFGRDEDKALSCSAGYGEIMITKVKHGSGAEFSAIANECMEQEEMHTGGEDFRCEFNVAELMMQNEPIPVDYVDETVDYVDEPVVDEPTEPVLSHHGHGHHHEGIRVEYVCMKQEAEVPQVFLSAMRRSQPEPLLTSANVKCDQMKMLADSVQIGKACGADDFSLTCDPQGVDPRIIVLKVKEQGAPHSHKNHKKRKQRQQLINDVCTNTATPGTCSFAADDFLLDTEGVGDNAGKNFKIKYLCSYGEPLPQEVCCEAMTAECLACSEGQSVDEFCLDPANAEYCNQDPIFLSSAEYEEPSEFLLQSALVKCGNTKTLSDSVDVGKVCSDHDFTLTCDATRGGDRVIVLKFKDTSAEAGAGKSHKKTCKARAVTASNLCDNQRGSGSCTFSLDDVIEAETDLATLTDHVFNVKYLCSYDIAA